jgi:hypothetical protein
MFENIGSVEWAKLSHSHGTADEVPARLAALVGPSDGDRAAALEYFWEYMLHQGSRYEASPYIVPFLFEVLENAVFPLPRELIDLLLGLAVGYGESFLPFGYDLEQEEQRFEEKSWKGLFSYDDARSTYYEVHKRADAFTKFLRPECNPDTRLSAGFAVAHFAQSLTGIQGKVSGYIECESDESQLQSLILCFGMLGRYANVKPNISVLTSYLESDCSQTLRVATSIALTTILGSQTPDLAVQTLLAALTESWILSSPRDDWRWWNEGDLLGYTALVLRLVEKDRRDELARALCKALAKAEACTFAIPQTLLDILFPEPKPATGRKVSEFDEVQRASLNALLRTQHWRDWMIDSKFLPSGLRGDDYRNALRKFVKEITGGQDGPDSSLLRRAGNVSSWDLKKHWP